jgi:arsenate reductase
MAEAFARIHGNESVIAFSAGSNPSGVVNPKAIASMNELHYDLSSHRSQGVTDLPAIEFDFVITMGCGDACPVVPAIAHEDWDIADPKHMPPEQISETRDVISRRVQELLSRAAKL